VLLRTRTLGPVVAACIITALSACDSPHEPLPPQVSICHVAGSTGTIMNIPSSELAAHLHSGDYVAAFHVSKQRRAADGVHYTRIGAALAAARTARLSLGETQTAACRITIAVDAGVFEGSVDPSADTSMDRWPLVIDVPDVSLVGSFAMQVDADDRATGTGVGGVATTLSPNPPLSFEETGPSQPLVIVNGHPNGSAGHGALIQGFVFESGHADTEDELGGQAVFSLRVHDLVIRGNRFEAGYSETIDLRATSAIVDHNFLVGTRGTCDMCLAGPGDFQATSNRLLAGGIPGILITPAIGSLVPSITEQYELPTSATVNATLTNNEVRDHQQIPVGVGIRVGAIGFEAPGVIGSSHVVASNNLLVHNRFAFMMEAAFPDESGVLKADIDLSLSDNIVSQSCQTDLLISFSRHTTGLGLSDWPYLHDSHYTLTLDGNLPWESVWYSHPAGHGNTLTVDGQTIPTGSRVDYDADRDCGA